MAYNSNIPLGPDRFFISQGDILQNFQAINTDTQVNHVVLNNADQGKHKFVQLVELTDFIETSAAGIPAVVNFPDFIGNPTNFGKSCTFDITEKAPDFQNTDPFRLDITTENFANPKFPPLIRLSSYKLPSGLLIKKFLVTYDFKIITATILLNEIGEQFATTYFAIATPINISSLSSDPGYVVYISDLTLKRCTLQFWSRSTLSRPIFSNDFQIEVTIFGRG